MKKLLMSYFILSPIVMGVLAVTFYDASSFLLLQGLLITIFILVVQYVFLRFKYEIVEGSTLKRKDIQTLLTIYHLYAVILVLCTFAGYLAYQQYISDSGV